MEDARRNALRDVRIVPDEMVRTSVPIVPIQNKRASTCGGCPAATRGPLGYKARILQGDAVKLPVCFYETTVWDWASCRLSRHCGIRTTSVGTERCRPCGARAEAPWRRPDGRTLVACSRRRHTRTLSRSLHGRRRRDGGERAR